MYNNGQTNIDAKNVCLDEKEKADIIKSNLDKILHYERYRTNDKPICENKNNNAVNTYFTGDDVRCSNAAVSDLNAYLGQDKTVQVADHEEIISENLRPSSTTMQFESSQDNDIFEDVSYKQVVKHEENFSISGKGKLLIAIYTLVVALILSLIIINSRMLRSLDSSISAFGTKIDDLNAEYIKVSEDLDVANSDEVIDQWAIDHGYLRDAA